MEKRPGILDDVGPTKDRHKRSEASRLVLRAVGAALFVGTAALILGGPSVMSPASLTAIEFLALGLGAAYAIFLAAHSRTTHVSLERAYSGHLEELSQRLRTMAYQDALTGLYNHRYFYEQFSHEIERSL